MDHFKREFAANEINGTVSAESVVQLAAMLSRGLVSGGANFFAAEREILEIKFAHVLWRADIAAVDDQTASHELSRFVPIDIAEFVPFGADQDGLGIAQASRRCPRDM